MWIIFTIVILLLLVLGLYLIQLEIGRKNWKRVALYVILLVACVIATRFALIYIASR